MGRERNTRERVSAIQKKQNNAGRHSAASASLYHQHHRQQRLPSHQPAGEGCEGHRGYSIPRWGGGPREPPSSRLGIRSEGQFTLFIDEFSSTATPVDLQQLFGRFGTVIDTFISRKKRQSKKYAFGFVRFKKWEEASKAVQELHGHVFFGRKITVVWARFQKGGRPFAEESRVTVNKYNGPRKILSPALRDERRYSDVLRGGKSVRVRQPPVEGGRTATATVQETKTTTKVNIEENHVLSGKLQRAVLVVTDKVLDKEKIETLLSGLDFAIVGVSVITRCKFAIFLEEEDDVTMAMAENSPLRSTFTDVKRWSEEDNISTRLTWIECKGIPPTCCSKDNFGKIGEIWGKPLKVDAGFLGLHSLTSAKILIETKHMQRIEDSIEAMWTKGSTRVWVSELHHNDVMAMDYGEEDDAELEDDEDQLACMGNDEYDDGEVRAEEDTLIQQGEDMVEEGVQEETQAMQALTVLDNTQVVSTAQEGSKEGQLTLSMVVGSPSVDDWWPGPLSCPARYEEAPWYDPIATVEAPMALNLHPVATQHSQDESQAVLGMTQERRPRGRPRRMACSLPDTLSVPSTPSLGSVEVNDTWHMATVIGLGCRNEDGVHEELRRSKRLQAMVESTTTSAR
ncbi:unnamed protein product [Amaranthus hypochondriacus]